LGEGENVADYACCGLENFCKRTYNTELQIISNRYCYLEESFEFFTVRVDTALILITMSTDDYKYYLLLLVVTTFNISTRDKVTLDGFWSDNRIYWSLKTRNYK
jgi:hypothetical protein